MVLKIILCQRIEAQLSKAAALFFLFKSLFFFKAGQFVPTFCSNLFKTRN